MLRLRAMSHVRTPTDRNCRYHAQGVAIRDLRCIVFKVWILASHFAPTSKKKKIERWEQIQEEHALKMKNIDADRKMD